MFEKDERAAEALYLKKLRSNGPEVGSFTYNGKMLPLWRHDLYICSTELSFVRKSIGDQWIPFTKG